MSDASDFAEAAAEHRQKLVKRIGDLERRSGRLEKCVAEDRIGDEAMVMAGEAISMRITLLRERCDGMADALADALADARSDHELLTRLVGRTGEAVQALTEWWEAEAPEEYESIKPKYSYTLIGQREYDAAQHDAEGPPPDAGMLESVQ